MHDHHFTHDTTAMIVGNGAVGLIMGWILSQTHKNIYFKTRHDTIELHKTNIHQPDGTVHEYDYRDISGAPQDTQIDLCVIAVKNYDVEHICQTIKDRITPNTVFLTLQNGVMAPEIVAKTFPDNTVYAASIFTNASKNNGDIYRQGDVYKMAYSRFHKGVEKGLSGFFDGSDLDVIYQDNSHAMLWNKLCFIAALAGITTYYEDTIGAILAADEKRALALAVLKETTDVAYAVCPELGDDLYTQKTKILLSLPPHSTSSLCRDVVGQQTNEAHSIIGAVVEKAKEIGIKTPHLSGVYDQICTKI